MNYYDQLTQFIFQEDQPEEADFIMIPGSGYGELAIRAAELYRMGYANKVIVSGKFSTLLPAFQGPVSPAEYVGRCYETEADFLGAVLEEHGVKTEDIIKEKRATFTYENALQIRKLLTQDYGFSLEKSYTVLLVCQAFHAKRSLMYFQCAFPNVRFLCCPAITQGISKENWFLSEKGIDTVTGEVTRCGAQFVDMIKGKDKVWKEILGEC